MTLTVTSLISILLFTLHWSDEITRGLEPGTLPGAWIGVVILVVWLSAILVLGEGRVRYGILLFFGIGGLGVLLLHMSRAGLVGGKIGASGTGVFFWVWQNITLGTVSAVSAILAARGLWRLRRAKRGNLTP
jgi:hypothetical protein